MILIALLGCVGGPPPDPAASTCDSGEVSQDCPPAPCGAGTWGDLPVDDRTIYVDAGSEGGTRTADSPFRTVQEGIDAAAGVGGLVAVAAGTYTETLTLGPGSSS